jgi:alkyl sulfatase BDS1-like metallo-beta-lactamase superfamily hydrolase
LSPAFQRILNITVEIPEVTVEGSGMTSVREVAPATAAVHDETLRYLDFGDDRDFADVYRGLIAELPDGGVVRGEDGRVVWDLAALAHPEDASSPATVNPSLWRQSKLMGIGGLYEVVPGIYQVRNHDLANLTVVETADSVVVIDTGCATETARYAMSLYRTHRPAAGPVAAVIFTHTHVDHFGGVLGVTSREEVAAGRVLIIAPGHDFERLAMGENILAGNVMARRAAYAFGELLPANERGLVGCGIGTAALTGGTNGYLSPTDVIDETGQTRVFGGITFEFQYTPDTEAPEEMHVWIPEYHALSCAENANHSLHNIQTLRGARTRDAARFAHYLDEALERYGDAVEVHWGPHTWPVWGNANVRAFLESQRDAYKFIHDQAMRLANHGYRPDEIAERLRFPDTLARAWWNRGYHGTLNHDLKAVFHKELGWFDGNPATLHPHPASVTAPRYVEAMGGPAALLDRARSAIAAGDYRWAAELLDHLVTAQPANADARGLLAEAYEQLGFQAEGPQWRNIYLTAALELRDGIQRGLMSPVQPEVLLEMPLDLLFDFVAVRLDGPRAADHPLSLNLEVSREQGSVRIRNGVLHFRRRWLPDADATVRMSRSDLLEILGRPNRVDSLIRAGDITVDGDPEALRALIGLLDSFDPSFPIVTPVGA